MVRRINPKELQSSDEERKSKMRIYVKRLNPVFLCLFIATVAFCTSASAHDMWLDIRDYNTPQAGEEITLTLAYDHHFPTRGFMAKEELKEIYMLDPEGNRIGIKSYSDVEFKGERPLKKEGTYLVAAEKKGGFFTKTTEGYKRGHSKKGLKNVIQCTYSAKYSKAIVNVGKAGGKTCSKVLGHELEIVPLADLGTVTQGDYFSIKIMFKGQPLSSSYVFATYLGFSTEKNTFAYATKTNKEGLAKIKMLQSGVWLITTSYMEDYPDSSECDHSKFSSTLTFEIR